MTSNIINKLEEELKAKRNHIIYTHNEPIEAMIKASKYKISTVVILMYLLERSLVESTKIFDLVKEGKTLANAYNQLMITISSNKIK